MSRPSIVKRRCGRCELLYDIPNIRESPVRETILRCFPCAHCGYTECDPEKVSGRCADCSIPFSIINHYAKGRCKRDYQALLRNTTNGA